MFYYYVKFVYLKFFIVVNVYVNILFLLVCVKFLVFIYDYMVLKLMYKYF